MPGTDIDTMPTRRAVDNTDWLKTIAIILVSVDHFGYFFIEDNQWWDVIGRLAAPVFFYLLGYAQTRKVPVSWLWLALMLTIMDSWNNDWTWVAPNILFSLALIRLARPYVQILLQRYGWVAFVLLVSTLFAMLPITADVVEYGSEGWMWALFGLCQRRYVDTRPLPGASQKPTAQKTNRNPGLMRLLACLIATGVCIWQEQLEYSFSEIQFAALVFGMGMLSIGLCLFLRGPSRFQPPSPLAIGLRYIGRRTLEIYAIQLAGFEIIINLLPDLAA